MQTTIHVFRPKGWKPDTHIEYTLWFKTADDRIQAIGGALKFKLFDSVEEQIKYVLRWQTPFVQNNWLRLELMVPNRDAYGNLQAGWMGDTGVLLATRQASPVPDNPG